MNAVEVEDFEPYCARIVEPLPILDRDERRAALAAAHYNVFDLRSDQVTIDLLSDSGTGATSIGQEAAAMLADERYAGSRSWFRFRDAVADLTGYPQILPVHQGRAGERILDAGLLQNGQISLSNTHFDTTGENVRQAGCQARDLPCPQFFDFDSPEPFKGNIDLEALTHTLDGPDGPRVGLVLMTLTNNGGGGQPVSIANLEATKALCQQHGVPMILDAARWAENAWLVGQREPGYARYTPRQIARMAFDLADGCLISLKKDGLGWAGGVLGLRDPALADRCRRNLIVTEGHPTYGGMSGHDMERAAVGLTEVADPAYLASRAAETARMARLARQAGVATVRPSGIHAVYVDAGRLLAHLPVSRFRGHTLACALYVEGGIRCSELGSLYLGGLDDDYNLVEPAPFELVRLAIPRRVYTRRHLDYVISVLARIAETPDTLTGYRITGVAGAPRHFQVRLAPAEDVAA